jgi:hypothetical protein
MLWSVKNKRKMVRVWWIVDSLKKFNYNIVDIHEYWELFFKTANLEWGDLFIKIKSHTKKRKN